MKIIVTKEEIVEIIREHLKAKGLNLKNSTGDHQRTHTEGEYEDAREVFDGLEFELDDK